MKDLAFVLLLFMLVFPFVRFVTVGVLLALGALWLVGLVASTPGWLEALFVGAGFSLGVVWHWNSLTPKSKHSASSGSPRDAL
jgi:hypothetical protein